MEMSPYKFNYGCSIKKPEWVHVVKFFKGKQFDKNLKKKIILKIIIFDKLVLI